MENLNLLFYKTFYSKLGQGEIFENDITAKGKKLTSAKFYAEDYKPVCSCIAPDKFLLKTSYPGLLAGIGYAHGVDSGNDIKVGFSFDYVTGQPYIPGSSVKGLLRSYFRHPEVIQQLLGKDLSVSDVRALEKLIFETDDDATADADIFFDAVIKCGDEEGHVLGFDSITPHGEDLTKNPVPIKMIKILPDVVIEFSFRLNQSKIGDHEISADEKKNLFKEILCTFGIGAKTNVGYGVLTAVDENEINVYPKRKIDEPEIGKYYDCTITGVKAQSTDRGKKYNLYVYIDSIQKKANINCNSASDKIKNNFFDYYKKGDRIVSKIANIYDDGGISMSYESAKK